MDRKRERSYNAHGSRAYHHDSVRKRRRDSASAGSESDTSHSGGHDDTTDHLQLRPGDLVGDRYEVLHESGVGTFGKVFLCRDKRLGRTVAVKVVRSIPRYTEAAKIEADILEDVNRADPAGVSLCVRFFQAFDYCGHYCMVFEALGPSLFDFISANKYRPAPLYCVQSWGDQLLTAIAFLHEMRLIHTDLKLENVLLVSREPFTKTDKLTSARTKHSTVLAPARTDIKLIDFGGSTYDHEYKSALINTRQYRAPEVILGLGWSMPSDVWSVGCILVELYTGELLFHTHDSAEHLALMEACLGPFPSSMLRASSSNLVSRYFDRSGRLRYPDKHASRDSVAAVAAQKPLEHIIHERDTVFLELLRGLLRLDPAERWTAKDALNHRFFTALRPFKPVPRPLAVPRRESRLYLPPPTMPMPGSASASNNVSAMASASDLRGRSRRHHDYSGSGYDRGVHTGTANSSLSSGQDYSYHSSNVSSKRTHREHEKHRDADARYGYSDRDGTSTQHRSRNSGHYRHHSRQESDRSNRPHDRDNHDLPDSRSHDRPAAPARSHSAPRRSSHGLREPASAAATAGKGRPNELRRSRSTGHDGHRRRPGTEYSNHATAVPPNTALGSSQNAGYPQSGSRSPSHDARGTWHVIDDGINGPSVSQSDATNGPDAVNSNGSYYDSVDDAAQAPPRRSTGALTSLSGGLRPAAHENQQAAQNKTKPSPSTTYSGLASLTPTQSDAKVSRAET